MKFVTKVKFINVKITTNNTHNIFELAENAVNEWSENNSDNIEIVNVEYKRWNGAFYDKIIVFIIYKEYK